MNENTWLQGNLELSFRKRRSAAQGVKTGGRKESRLEIGKMSTKQALGEGDESQVTCPWELSGRWLVFPSSVELGWLMAS